MSPNILTPYKQNGDWSTSISKSNKREKQGLEIVEALSLVCC
jgi:hypothetical protein